MPLPEPFFVIATQNPQDQVGTFPLPESQLDRFLMRVHLGYPAAAAERELLSGVDRRDLINSLSTVATLDTLRRLQQRVADIHVSRRRFSTTFRRSWLTPATHRLECGLVAAGCHRPAARGARLGADIRPRRGDSGARAGSVCRGG